MKPFIATTLFLISSLFGFAQIGFEFSEINKLPDAINSPYEESCPLFDPVSERLYFTRTLHPENKGGKDLGQDLWYIEKNGNGWGEPKNDLEELNNYLNNSAIGISEDGERLYLMGTYIRKINLQTGFSVSNQEGGDWPRPEPLDLPALNLKAPLFYGGFVSKEEDILIVSMNSKDSKGEEDLYICLKTEDGWSKPLWMGDSINSENFEISPYLFDDGKTLMFASNGMGGLGDCDIFYSYRKDSSWTNWTTPKNAGSTINSEKFDAFPYAVESRVYFASNRNDSLSNLFYSENELYFQEADTVLMTFESFGNRMLEVGVDVIDSDGNNLGRYFTNKEGVLAIPGLKERKNYKLIPSHEEIDFSLTTPFILNRDGDYIEELALGDDGMVNIAPKTPEQLAASPAIDKPEYVTGMRGIFEVDRVPVKDITLALTDASGKVIQYAVTNRQGRFAFAETPDSLDLKIKVVSELEYVKRNGVIYYTDENGNKLFKTRSDENGAFAYQKIKAQELAQLKMLTKTDTKMKLDETASSGVFKYDNLPKEGVKLRLYDENNNLIEEVITDADGRFQFSKLQADQNFQIRPADEALGEGSLVFTDRSGKELGALESSEFGFNYKALDADIVRGVQLMAAEDSDLSLGENFVFSIGLFKYKNLPKEGITLRLLDENDRVIETVTTDENGHFVFSMLKPEMNYKVQVVGIEDSSLIESQLYFVDKAGTVLTGLLQDKKYTFNELSPDYFFSIAQVNSGETELIITESFKDVMGKFNYKNLGREGVLLELLDENNKVIETVYTDENGNFRFKQLAKESNYFVRVSEDDASLLDAASFEMLNEKNEPLEQEEVTEEGFKFKTLPRSPEEIAAYHAEKDKEMDFSKFMREDAEEMPDGGTEALLGDKNDLNLKTLYFNFNSVRLSNYDRYHLNHSVYQRVARSGQPVLIVGYTCDLGTSEVNKEVAFSRADAIKAYLIKLGLDPDRIEVDGVVPPENSNMTYGQRLEARRVEIFHLAP